jgi:hypothetical protein
MNRADVGLKTMTRAQRRQLRALLVRATAASDRPSAENELDELVRSDATAALPAAAALHRVAGSVLRGLEDVDGVPSDVRAKLSALQQKSRIRHLVTVGALSQIASAFDENGLSWVAMKGPVVADLLYADAGDRSYNDLDLLVSRRDFPRGVRILEDLGYQHFIHNWALAEDMLAGQVAMSGFSVHVDLHWHLHYSQQDRQPFAIDPEAMVERARTVVVSGVSAPTLDPVDTLLTLAFHAARSGGHRLVWLKDVERAAAVDGPDLDELVRRGRTFHCAPPVGLILNRARAVLDAEIPDEVVEAMAPASLLAADRFVSRLAPVVPLNDRENLSRVFTRSVRASVRTSLSDAPARGVRFLRRHLLPPHENETDDPAEKQSFLNAVAVSPDR